MKPPTWTIAAWLAAVLIAVHLCFLSNRQRSAIGRLCCRCFSMESRPEALAGRHCSPRPWPFNRCASASYFNCWKHILWFKSLASMQLACATFAKIIIDIARRCAY